MGHANHDGPEIHGHCVPCLIEKLGAANLENGKLKAQLHTAQDVIQKHVADQVEGLHCVDCTAEESQSCDCPMLVPIFEAMKGYLPSTIEDLLGECRECNRLVRDCGGHVPIPANTEKRNNEAKPILCSKCGTSFHSGKHGSFLCEKCERV